MLHWNLGKNLGWLLFFVLMSTPVAAYTEKVSQDVGGMLHIEPNDNPQAGKTTQAWIILTRKGGKLIPLKECNCQIAIYRQPHKKGDAPLLKPQLKALSKERHKDIPGAEIVFPKAGAYDLELRGTAKSGSNFRPFKLLYTINVSS
jgi:hypothetical protein